MNLNEQDFDTIIEALDAYPKKMVSVLEIKFPEIASSKPSSLSGFTKELFESIDRSKKAAEAENRKRIEDIKILQGKVLMLKRNLMSDGTKQTNAATSVH